MKEPKRFNELKNCIHGISSKVLTENKGEDLRKVMAEIRMPAGKIK